MIKRFKNPILFIITFFIVVSIVYGLASHSLGRSGVEDTLYLTLNNAIDLALKNNKSIMITLEKVKEQAAGKGVARAAFLPQISLSGTYTRLSVSQGFPVSGPIFGTIPVFNLSGDTIGFTTGITGYDVIDTIEMVKKNNYDIKGSVTQTLFTWGKLINAYKIAGLTLDIEKESYRKAIEDLKLQVTESFYQTMLADRSVELMNESYQQMEKHIAQIEQLYKNGMVGQLDLLRARVQLTNMRSQVIRMENARTIAYDAFKMVVGIDQNTPFILEGEFAFEPYEIMLDEAIDIALQERADIKNMRRTVGIAQKGLAIQRTANLPTVFSAFNYDYQKPFGFTDEDWGQDWNVTVGVSMPLFSGGANMYKLKQGKAQLKQAKLGLAMLEDGIKLDVKSAFYNFEQEKQILSYQDENVRTAEQALNLAEEKYINGLITNLEYIDTQLALTQAKFDQISSITNCIITRTKLLNALGR